MVNKLEKIVGDISENGREYTVMVGTALLPYIAGLTIGAVGKSITESDPEMGLAIQAAPLALGFNVNLGVGTLFYTMGIATNYLGTIC